MSDVRILWDLYWPAIAVGFLLGTIGGVVFLRPERRRTTLGLGAVALAVIAFAALWHGPAGAAERFRSGAEQVARTTLVYYEMAAVQARLDSDPLTQTLILSGPADDFQRGELVRILTDVPGVGAVRWSDQPAGFALPLLAIAELLALAGFGLGLLLAYLIEIRRRARAEWRW